MKREWPVPLRTKIPLDELDVSVVEDLEYLEELCASTEITNAALKSVSTILRRLLIEGNLQTVASRRTSRIHVECPNSGPFVRAAEKRTLHLFQSANVRVLGVEISALCLEKGTRTSVSGYHPDNRVSLKLKRYLKQKVFYYDGNFATREDVIKYAANKMGGVHFDPSRPGVFNMLDDVRTMISIERGIEDVPTIGMCLEPNREKLGTLVPKGRKLDPVLVEVLATARFLCESENIMELKRELLAEQS